MKSIKIFTAVFFSIFFSANFPAQDKDIIKVETDLVSISVAVRDKKGTPVNNLTKKEFEIYDNGIKQPISYFSSQDAEVSYGIVYDMHPTSEERTGTILETLRQFSKELPAADDFFITVFNERGNLTLDFIPTAEQIADNLSMKDPRSLYDAVAQAAEKLRTRRNLKQTLIIISDGADHNSHHSYNTLTKQLRGLNVQIYAVLLDEKADRSWNYADITRQNRQPRIFTDATGNDRTAIGDLTLKSGGAAYPESAGNRQRLYTVYRQIAAEVKDQYVISFYPNAPDGKWHRILVRMPAAAKQNKKYALTYRLGYQSPPKK